LFPPYSDIFDIRCKQTSIDQDLGLLHAIDERLAVYGWLTTTGVKLLIVVDVFGQEEAASAVKMAGPAISGLRDSDMKPVSFGKIFRGYLHLYLTVQHRRSEHCKVRISSSCKIHSTPLTITYRFLAIKPLLSPLVSKFRIKDLLRM
jgi:predicted XRE-type DNA-binding protein